MRSPLGILMLILVSSLNGEKDVFKATAEWKEIVDGQKVPSGLHYRINLETGKKEAKLLDNEELKPSKETAAVLSDANVEDEPEVLDDDQIARMRAKMKKMNFNRDVEHIKVLMAHYDNSTNEVKRLILDDLDYYLHQIDNANDFIFLEGFSKIVIPALDSNVEDLIEGAAILLGSASQSNIQVQISAEKAGLIKKVLDLYETWSAKSDVLSGRLVFALSSLVRGNDKNLEQFSKLGGEEKLLRHLSVSNSSRVDLKSLSFAADILSVVDENPNQIISNDGWCTSLLQDKFLQKDDLDHVEKFVYCLLQFKRLCHSRMASSDPLRAWLMRARYTVVENQESETDFEKTVEGITELMTVLNFTKIEL